MESSSILLSGLCFAIMISLFISSISVAYCVTANTPPWRMLFLIVIGRVLPSVVLIVALFEMFVGGTLYTGYASLGPHYLWSIKRLKGGTKS